MSSELRKGPSGPPFASSTETVVVVVGTLQEGDFPVWVIDSGVGMFIPSSLAGAGVSFDTPPRISLEFTSIGGGGDIDLTAQSGVPAIGATQLLVNNRGTAAENLTYTTVAGETITQTLQPGENLPIFSDEIATLVAATSGADIDVTAWWRYLGSPTLNP